MKRLKDYTFVVFEIEIENVTYTVKAKVWFSFINKEAFVTESLGQSLYDSVRESIEIDSFDIEDILNRIGSLYEDGSIDTEEIEKVINEEVRKDYTKYFSLDNA